MSTKRHVVRYMDPATETWQGIIVRGEPDVDAAKTLARRFLFKTKNLAEVKTKNLAEGVDMHVFEVPGEDISADQADGVGDPRSAHDFLAGDMVRLRGTDKFWVVLAGPIEKHDQEAGRTLLLRPVQEQAADEEGAYNPVAFVLELRT